MIMAKKSTQSTVPMTSGVEPAKAKGHKAKSTKPPRANPKGASNLRQRDPIDYVTVLGTAERGKRACKRFFMRDGRLITESYDAGFRFMLINPSPVSCIAELSELLFEIERMPECFVIRGAPIHADLVGTIVRRTGSGEGLAFKGNFQTPPQGRHYIEIDIDDYPIPRSLSLRKDVRAVCEYLIGHLPLEFRDVSYHYQLSSQAGMKRANTVRIHLWFWLHRPIPDLNLKAWANHVNQGKKGKLIDPALFQHVQVHYTAAPIFDGVPDPFPVRSALVVKRLGSVDIDLSCLSESPPLRSPLSTKASKSLAAPAGSGFDYHVAQIGDHPGGAGFRKPLLSATASYVATYGRDGTDREVLYQILRDAVLAADARDHTAAEIEDRASEAVIMPMIDSAVTKFGDVRLPRAKSRRVQGIAPHYQVGSHSEDIVKNELDTLLNNVF